MLREFHFGFDELLDMPIKRFWFINSQIERLWAEKELRDVMVHAAVTSSEAFKTASERLERTMGTIVVFKPEPVALVIDTRTGTDKSFDRAGLHALKSKAG